ncbi:hypothetical protein GH140_05180 [bacterium]|nr:hypothetical protein [bacterium]
MKSLTEYLVLNTEKRREFINITGDVEALVGKSGVKEGLCLVNAMHITASVFINDDEGGLHDDFEEWLTEKLQALRFEVDQEMMKQGVKL